MQKESSLHLSVCNYLKLAYPNVLFNTDLSGIKLTIGQAVKLKNLRSNRAFPDLFIIEPRAFYNGLFLELKTDEVKIFNTKNCYSTPHIKEQAEMLIKLSNRGFRAEFACGFDEAKKIIDEYLRQ